MADQQERQGLQVQEQNQGGAQPSGSSGQNIERKGAMGATVPVRRGQYTPSGPFSLMRRISEDMDRYMDRFFSDFFEPDLVRSMLPGGFARIGAGDTHWPQIEVHHEGDKLVIQADVPGLKKDDINVELRDRELCISGERRSETERSERGYYRSERSYGSFFRTIPLPEGTKPDTASASFDNGVLRIEMEAPGGSAAGRGRRIEVREGSPH
jgi:HSP20 family protein